MPRKDIFLTEEQIEFIKEQHGGKFSEFCRKAVEMRIEKEKEVKNKGEK